MPRNRPALAKLSPPRLYAITRRKRLFTLLKEQARSHAVIWVAGPPGAGKTTLVASYLAEHKQRTLWYQVDPGDADLATFFHYLAQAAQHAAGRRRLRLPALTPEFMADIPGYTRRFMRELWTKVPLPATIVLDNYQDLPAGATLHSMLPIALTEFPSGATLVIISRDEAPDQWARDLTQAHIGHIRWGDLQLTLEEIQALAASTPGLDQTRPQTIQAQTKGWVAGTVLMLEQLRTRETWTIPRTLERDTSLFDYFAQQVFSQLGSQTRTVLLRTALLPWMTGPMAEEVSGQSGADQILRDLYQRGLFVDCRTEGQVIYHYHDLFRKFLVDSCLRQYSEEELWDLRRTAAVVAEQTGQQDTAVALYAETHSWNDLSRLICELCPALLAQGRYQTVQGYIAALPQPERQSRPWLLYWNGMSRLVFNPSAAREDFEAAYGQFENLAPDPVGMALTSSAIIESYYCELNSMAPTIGWGDRLHHLLHKYPEVFSPMVQAIMLSRLNGLLLACPHHPLLQAIYRRIDHILTSLEDSEAIIGVATVFNILALWKGDLATAHLIVTRVRSLTRETSLSDLARLTWKASEANYAWNVGDWNLTRVKVQEAYELADAASLAIFKPMIWGTQSMGRLTEGDYSGAEDSVNLLQAVTHPSQRLALGQCSFYRAGIALMRGDLQSAHQHAIYALDTSIPLCLPFLTGNCRIGLAKILIELGEFEEARETLAGSLESAQTIRSVITEIHYFLTMAQLSFKEGHIHETEGFLREALLRAREGNQLCLEYWWRPTIMAELLAYALEAGIEVEYVRNLIRRRGLCATSAALTEWPYPIKVTTLGRFEVAVNGVPLTTTRKMQRKPTELLKYLCAAGVQGVHQEVVEESLWPKADGEAADQVFRTTLHRLRKLLRHDDAVYLSDRQVSLDPSLVSLDYLAFERLVQEADQTDELSLVRALQLYRGHFLQGETASWVLPVRERLRARFLELAERLGTLLEKKDQPGEAARTYLRALEVEPTAELICRQAMITYVRLGRRSEAIEVYQRLNQALHTKLGVSPTQQTVSLYHSIAKI